MKTTLHPITNIISKLRPGDSVFGLDENERPFSGTVLCVHLEEKENRHFFVHRDDERKGEHCRIHQPPTSTPSWILNEWNTRARIAIKSEVPSKPNKWLESEGTEGLFFFPKLWNPTVKLQFEDCKNLIIV